MPTRALKLEAARTVLEVGAVLNYLGALIIRIGFWDIVYHNFNKEPPK